MKKEVIFECDKHITISEDFLCEYSTYVIRSKKFQSGYPTHSVCNVVFDFNRMSKSVSHLFKNSIYF